MISKQMLDNFFMELKRLTITVPHYELPNAIHKLIARFKQELERVQTPCPYPYPHPKTYIDDYKNYELRGVNEFDRSQQEYLKSMLGIPGPSLPAEYKKYRVWRDFKTCGQVIKQGRIVYSSKNVKEDPKNKTIKVWFSPSAINRPSTIPHLAPINALREIK